MRYIVLFEDDPKADPGIRARLMADHLAFLAAERIIAAGPLREPGGRPAGGIWLLDAESPERIEALIQADPFWPTGLRKFWRVLEWNCVYADGQRLIVQG